MKRKETKAKITLRKKGNQGRNKEKGKLTSKEQLKDNQRAKKK